MLFEFLCLSLIDFTASFLVLIWQVTVGRVPAPESPQLYLQIFILGVLESQIIQA